MASTLAVRLVSPQKEVFQGEAASVVVPAWDGMAGILPGHAAFITLLGHGELAIEVPGGGSQKFFVAGGVLKVEGNDLTVLVEYAGEGPPDQLPPEADFHPEDLAEEALGDEQ
ncbi:MAG: ATP synthase F1 subunit epsilon [Gemmatimonadetes bacterium]|nr:ATP synthase F1 subunit epsilon [Gemmatimonadota bacterium]